MDVQYFVNKHDNINKKTKDKAAIAMYQPILITESGYNLKLVIMFALCALLFKPGCFMALLDTF